MDNYDWDYSRENVILARLYEDDDTPLGQEEWANRAQQAVIAELSIYNLKGVIATGESYNLPTTDDRVIYIDEEAAKNLWQEYKEARFDEYEYLEELRDKFEDILDRLEDGIRIRFAESSIDAEDIKAWANKWQVALETLEDQINQTDGQAEGIRNET